MIIGQGARILHWIAHTIMTALVGALGAFCVTRELGAEALNALGAGGCTFGAILMAFAAFFTATGALKSDPPTGGETSTAPGSSQP